MTSRTEVLGKLAILGVDSKEVATNLKELGITGKRGDGDACPLFNYLKDHFGGDVTAVTYNDVILRGPFGIGHRRVPLTKATNQFVSGFDMGLHPILEAHR